MKIHTEKDDRVMDLRISHLLRTGTALSALIVIVGGLVFLLNHGGAMTDYRTFHALPPQLTTVSGILHDAMQLHGKGIIQLGLLVLIATPVARVLFAMISFWVERDALYVVIASIVLIVLLYSLFFHGA